MTHTQFIADFLKIRMVDVPEIQLNGKMVCDILEAWGLEQRKDNYFGKNAKIQCTTEPEAEYKVISVTSTEPEINYSKIGL